MKPCRKAYGFRDDATSAIRRNGFELVDLFGWCHPEGYCAIIERCGQRGLPWVLTVYASAIPNPKTYAIAFGAVKGLLDVEVRAFSSDGAKAAAQRLLSDLVKHPEIWQINDIKEIAS
jgi:hypothetical protein